MGSVAFLWLVDFLAFLYYLFTLYLIFSNPQPNIFQFSKIWNIPPNFLYIKDIRNSQ